MMPVSTTTPPEAEPPEPAPSAPSRPELVRLAVRLGWTVADAHRRLAVSKVEEQPRASQPSPGQLSERTRPASERVEEDLSLIRQLVAELAPGLVASPSASVTGLRDSEPDVADLDRGLRRWLFVSHDDDLLEAYELGLELSDLAGPDGAAPDEWTERVARVTRRVERLAAVLGPGRARALRLALARVKDSAVSCGKGRVVRLHLSPTQRDAWRSLLVGNRSSVGWLQELLIAQAARRAAKLVVLALALLLLLLLLVFVACVVFAINPAPFSAPDAAWYTRVGAALVGVSGLVTSAWRATHGPLYQWLDDWRLGILQQWHLRTTTEAAAAASVTPSTTAPQPAR